MQPARPYRPKVSRETRLLLTAAALAVAVNGGRPPALARGAGHAFGVEPLRDDLGRQAGGIVIENPPDDSGLALADAAVAAHEGPEGVHFGSAAWLVVAR